MLKVIYLSDFLYDESKDLIEERKLSGVSGEEIMEPVKDECQHFIHQSLQFLILSNLKMYKFL
jgi:hypothetical protein